METGAYAISKYPDVVDVYNRLEALISQPLRPIRREKMQDVLNYFEKQCEKSKGLNDEAKQIIPGGVQHNLAFNYPFPIAMERADGAYLWDADGNQYYRFPASGRTNRARQQLQTGTRQGDRNASVLRSGHRAVP